MKPIKFGIVGGFQTGKSTLINCLLGQLVATVGDGRATTHSIVNYVFSESEHLEIQYIFGDQETINFDHFKDSDNKNLSLLDETFIMSGLVQQNVFGIVGTSNNWGEYNDYIFKPYIGNWIVLRRHTLKDKEEFRIRANGDWNINFGIESTNDVSTYVKEGVKYKLVLNGNNITVNKDSLLDIYFNVATKELYLSRCVDEFIVNGINVFLNNNFLKNYTLVDMPGYGYDGHDNKYAEYAISQVDYALVVVNTTKAIGGEESKLHSIIRVLKQYQIPYYLVANCIDDNKWNPHNRLNLEIVQNSVEYIDFYRPLSYPHNNQTPIVNFLWYWFSQHADDPIFNNYENLLYKYGLLDERVSKQDIKKASNFHLITEIFSMDNRVYLELRREFKEELNKLKDEVCPVGAIQAFAFDRIPKGWVICDGRSLDPEVHSDLFHAIGTTFGGNGKTSFSLPDLRGSFIRGWSADGDDDSDRRFGSFQNDAIQEHAHTAMYNNDETEYGGEHCHNIKYQKTTYGYGGLTSSTYEMKEITSDDYLSSWVHSTEAVRANGQHNHKLPQICVQNVKNTNHNIVKTAQETRPKNVALLYCIKVDSSFIDV